MTTPLAEVQRAFTRICFDAKPSDADLAVLDAQLATAEPLDEAEKAHSLTVGPEHPLPVERLRALLAG